VPTRSDWLQAGLTAVADDGPDGLRIDRLCRRLGVSKGSFHHHFAGAGDFKLALLDAYETLVVEALNDAIEQTAAITPQESLAGLTAAITSTQSFYRPELEVAIRAWAFSDSQVRAVQERVDRQRLVHETRPDLRHLLGYDPRWAELAAPNDADRADQQRQASGPEAER